nr:MAG TPA: hypothetical protein [Bacteriophage sp.]
MSALVNSLPSYLVTPSFITSLLPYSGCSLFIGYISRASHKDIIPFLSLSLSLIAIAIAVLLYSQKSPASCPKN